MNYEKIFGQDWDPTLSDEQNLKDLKRALEFYKKLAKINSFFMRKLSDWLEEWNGEDSSLPGG